MCSGSEPDQMNLIPVSFTLMETVVLNVRRVSRLDLHRNVSTASLRTSARLMPGLITALWPHVERFCLEMEQNWTLKVKIPPKRSIIIIHSDLFRSSKTLIIFSFSCYLSTQHVGFADGHYSCVSALCCSGDKSDCDFLPELHHEEEILWLLQR